MALDRPGARAMKVSELTDALLDKWVAKAEGRCAHERTEEWSISTRVHRLQPSSGVTCLDCRKQIGDKPRYSPSTSWSQGGPIIEREGIGLVPKANGEQWSAGIDQFITGGDTALIAAMRCYVASKFGEEVPDNG